MNSLLLFVWQGRMHLRQTFTWLIAAEGECPAILGAGFWSCITFGMTALAAGTSQQQHVTEVISVTSACAEVECRGQQHEPSCTGITRYYCSWAPMAVTCGDERRVCPEPDRAVWQRRGGRVHLPSSRQRRQRPCQFAQHRIDGVCSNSDPDVAAAGKNLNADEVFEADLIP